MKKEHWSDKYIGKLYKEESEGPDAFYCWSLVRTIKREVFNIDLPKVPFQDGKAIISALVSERNLWRSLRIPIEGCLVETRNTQNDHHVGIWTEADRGLIIHAVKGVGVVADSIATLKMGFWGTIKFWDKKI